VNAPQLLTYDDLPPGSDIRRVYDGDSIHITVPAGEPPAAVMKQAALDGLAWGATSSWALLLLAFVMFYFGVRANRISGVTLTWAWTFFAIFCAALVMLVSWIRYGMIVDALRAGRRQATILAATPQRLLIETSGAFGAASYDLPREQIMRLDIGRGIVRDIRERPHRLERLTLALRDGRTLTLLPGRDRRELYCVVAALRQALAITEPEKSSRTS
jgi:hypothetical protein